MILADRSAGSPCLAPIEQVPLANANFVDADSADMCSSGPGSTSSVKCRDDSWCPSLADGASCLAGGMSYLPNFGVAVWCTELHDVPTMLVSESTEHSHKC